MVKIINTSGLNLNLSSDDDFNPDGVAYSHSPNRDLPEKEYERPEFLQPIALSVGKTLTKKKKA